MGSTRAMLKDKGKLFRKDFMDKWNEKDTGKAERR